MKVAWKTDVGKVRKNNEDCLLVAPELGLLIVADGMGGHRGGEVASTAAVEVIASFLREKLPGEDRANHIGQLIREAMQKAREEICARAREDSAYRGMGTTVALAVCQGDMVHIAHVGDSRAYLIHQGEMRQLTDDHSVVAQMVKTGQLSPRAARGHRLSHVITRCLGSPGSAEADLQCVEWGPGDYLLLCSDGLTNMVEDTTIRTTILQGREDIVATSERLVELAKANGGKDNISVILAYQNGS